MEFTRNIILTSTALTGLALLVAVPLNNVSAAPCAGDFSADCELDADIVAPAVVGNVAGDVTITIDANRDITSTVDALAGAQGTFIITDGTSNTINQSGAVGGSAPIDSITIGASDVWNASADVNTNSGVIFSSGGGTLNVSAGTFASDIIGAGGADAATFTGGTVTGDISLGAGTDLISIGGTAVITGALDGGAGSNDNITLTGDFTTGNTISNFDLFDLDGNRLTVAHAISGVSAATETGLDLNSGDLDINSGGSVRGAIIDSAGTGTLTYGANGAGGTFNLGGIIEDVEFIINTGTVDTNGNALGATVTHGLSAVTVNNGARFNINDNVTSDGALTNNGTIFIDAGNTLTAATHVAGAGTFILELEREVGDETPRIGNLTISGGGFDLTAPAAIEIDIATTSAILPEETTLLIVNGGAPLINPPAALTAVTDNSYIYDSYIQQGSGANANNIYAIIRRKSLEDSSSTSNNSIIANALFNNLSESSDPTVLALQANIVGATTQKQFNDRLEATLPTVDGAIRAAGIATAENTFSLTSARLDGLRRNKKATGMASGGVTEGIEAWIQPFAHSATQDLRDDIDGYESDTFGIAVGFDNSSIFEETVLGLALAFASTDVTSNNVNQTDTEVTSFLMSIYADHDFEGGTYLNAQLGYTYNDIKTKRYNVGGQAGVDAAVDYGGDQFSTYLEVGHDYEWGNYTTLTPFVSSGLTYYTVDTYSEIGAGGSGLLVETSDSSRFDLGLGIEASWLYRSRNGSYIKPKLHTKLNYDFIGDAVQATTRFRAGGQEFVLKGSDPAQLSYNTGLGFTYLSRSNWEVSADYNFEYKEDYNAHSGFMKLSYSF